MTILNSQPTSSISSSLYIHGVQMKSTDIISKGLTKIHGVGHTMAVKACRSFSIPLTAKLGERTRDQLSRVERWISENCMVESDRRRKTYENIKRLMSIASNRGIRMRNGRPVRGQRTSTNAKTASRLNRYRIK